MENDLKFVVAGHVDHGKSTLIGRLLYDTNSLPPDKLDEIGKMSKESADGIPEFAFVMDHLEEERSEGITIDTAQVFFQTKKRQYIIIDAPGHKQFLKNMITGSTQAEAALLLIDIEEGLREQTHRHAYMLSLLGIKQVIVVINKIDLLDYSQEKFNQVSSDIVATLKQMQIAPITCIPVSARIGDNIANHSEKTPWYNGLSLLESLDKLKNHDTAENGPLRFPIQDIYDIDGEKILVGKIASGILKPDTKIIFHPSGKSATVKEIKILDGTKEKACAGESIGITLTDQKIITRNLKRGAVACDLDNSPAISNVLTATIFWMNGEPLKTGDTIEFQCATQGVTCKVKAINQRMNSSSLQIIDETASELQNTEVAQVTFKMDNYVCTDPFEDIAEMGRFVLIRHSDTVAGGIIQ